MRPAKQTQFYQSIRRKQIDEVFRKHRRALQSKETNMINAEQQVEQVEIFKTIMNDLRSSVLKLDYFQVLENLKCIWNVLRKSSGFVLKNAAKADHKLLEIVVEIFGLMFDSELNAHQLEPLFHKGVAILEIILSNEEIKEGRIVECGALNTIKNMLSLKLKHNDEQLCNLFSCFGNFVCRSKVVANHFIQINLHSVIFDLFLISGPTSAGDLTKQFLFLFRCLFDQIPHRPHLSQQHFTLCSKVATESCSFYLSEGLADKSIISPLQDSIQLLNRLIDYKILNLRSQKIPYEDMVDSLAVQECPDDLKKEILLFLDTVIVMDDQVVTNYLVKDQQMLMKMWSVDLHLKYIVYNIFANLALESAYKENLRNFITPIRLQLIYNQHSKELLTFLFNYLYSQKFELKSKLQESFVQILLTIPETTKQDILVILANIWLGLLRADYEYLPPTYITENQQLCQSDQLRQIIGQKGLLL